MKQSFSLFLVLILNSLVTFGQNDLKASADFSTYFKRTKELNRQIRISDSLYKQHAVQKSLTDSISLANEMDEKKDSSEQLGPVFLTSKKIFEYGYHQRKGFFSRLFHKKTKVLKYVNNVPFQKTVYIKDSLSTKTLLIEELLLRIWSDNRDSLARIQVHLYPVDIKHQKIGYDLLKNCIVQLGSNRHGLKRIDISSEQIYMPSGGILLSVENLNPNEKVNVEWKFNKEDGGSNSYWIKNEKDQTRIAQFWNQYKNFRDYNFMFGLSTIVLE